MNFLIIYFISFGIILHNYTLYKLICFFLRPIKEYLKRLKAFDKLEKQNFRGSHGDHDKFTSFEEFKIEAHKNRYKISVGDNQFLCKPSESLLDEVRRFISERKVDTWFILLNVMMIILYWGSYFLNH